LRFSTEAQRLHRAGNSGRHDEAFGCGQVRMGLWVRQTRCLCAATIVGVRSRAVRATASELAGSFVGRRNQGTRRCARWRERSNAGREQDEVRSRTVGRVVCKELACAGRWAAMGW
jgi:hypothetical protein